MPQQRWEYGQLPGGAEKVQARGQAEEGMEL